MAEEPVIRDVEFRAFKAESLAIIESLQKRIARLERPHTGLPEEPLTDIDVDKHFDLEIIDGKVTLGLDVDSLREELPPLPDATVDRYQHCTDPDIYSEIFLPVMYADGAVASGATVVVFRLSKDMGGELCYFLVEANVQEQITPNVDVLARLDACEDCTDAPESGDTGDQGIPFFAGSNVVDIDCANDGSGDLLVTFYNGFTNTFSTERKTGCCCDSPPTTGGESGDTLDRWSVCSSDQVGGDDIYLNPSIKDFAAQADPVIQDLVSGGCCYELAERGTTGNLETAWPNGWSYLDGCGDADCGCPVDCFDACQQAPTSTPTGSHTTGACSQSTPLTMPDNQTYTSTASYHQWTWDGNNTITGVDTLTIRCHKTTNEVAATITAGATTPSWGGSDSVWSGFKVMTGVTCSGAELAGTLVLDGLDGGCGADQWTVVL